MNLSILGVQIGYGVCIKLIWRIRNFDSDIQSDIEHLQYLPGLEIFNGTYYLGIVPRRRSLKVLFKVVPTY